MFLWQFMLHFHVDLPQAPTFAFWKKPAHLDAILYRQRAAGIKAHEGGKSHVQHVLPQRKGLRKTRGWWMD